MTWFDEFKEGVKLDYGVGRDDRAKMHYAERALKGKDDDSPRLVNMSATYPISYRTRELLGTADKDAVRARSDMGIGPLPTKAGAGSSEQQANRHHAQCQSPRQHHSQGSSCCSRASSEEDEESRKAEE